MSALEAKATGQETTAATAIMNNDDDDGNNEMTIVNEDEEEEELFELDIALLRDAHDDDRHRHRRRCVDDNDGHALLANCLLPASSVSKAVPVTARSIVSSCHPFSGHSSSRRFFLFTAAGGGGSSSRRRLGRAAAASRGSGPSSARFCPSSRGFESMGNFHRY